MAFKGVLESNRVASAPHRRPLSTTATTSWPIDVE